MKYLNETGLAKLASNIKNNKIPTEIIAEYWDNITPDSSIMTYVQAAQADTLLENYIQQTYFGIDPVGSHNSFFRGKNLGNALTETQSAAIRSGQFNDLYTGDYWQIPVSFTYYQATTDTTAQDGKTYYADTAGTVLETQPTIGTDISEAKYCEAVAVNNANIKWRVAGFNYWYNVGDTNFATPHAVIVPDSCLYYAQMHINNVNGYAAGPANTTEGGYMATDLFKGLGAAIQACEAAFGADHIPEHRVLLPTTCTGGKYTSWAWQTRRVDIMTETMVYGHRAWGAPANNGYSVASQKSQLPLFAICPRRQNIRENYWLQDVVSSAYFAVVNRDGFANSGSASARLGVRPAFPLI